MKKIILNLGILITIFLLIACTHKSDLSINSPDNSIQLSFIEIEGKIKYKLQSGDETIVDSSEISINPDAAVKIIKTEHQTVDTTWETVWGQFSEIRDNYNEIIMTIDMDGVIGKLYARVYDEGVGFRFKIDDVKAEDKFKLYCEYRFDKEDEFFYPAGENEPIGPIKINDLKNPQSKLPNLSIPVVVEKSNKKHLSILESDLYSAKGFSSMQVFYEKNIDNLVSINKPKAIEGELITPWRIILISENAGDLVTSTMPINLAAPNQIENTDWIKPGIAVWDWRVHGYTTKDGFTYGTNTESYKRFIDFAVQKEIQYFLIDATWFSSASKGHFEISKELDLQAVINYAEEKEVDLLLYYDRKRGEYGDENLFSHFNSLGMKGMKYGFMGTNVEFTRNAIEQSAKNKLIINFHDSPVPFTGIRRTYPNAITRENCHAQLDSRKTYTPETFIKMALINAIQGPLDMNNGNFDITGINRGDREKGPKKLNSYLTTVASEAARTLIIFSGTICIPDAPEAYNAKADLFEFIEKMPVGKWDESKILNSKIGKHITTARRHGEEWFIGSAIDQQGGTLDINLDFLDDNKKYDVTLYEDTDETHCKTNPEAYQVRKTEVEKGDLIQAKMAPGGGHAMWIRPKTN